MRTSRKKTGSGGSTTSTNPHTPITGNVLDFIDAIPKHHGDMAVLQAAGTLIEGYYMITDPNEASRIVLRSEFGNTFSTNADALFFNPDFQNIGDYSDINTQTVIGSFLGNWSGTLPGAVTIGDIVLNDGVDDKYYTNISGTNTGSDPLQDTTNWQLVQQGLWHPTQSTIDYAPKVTTYFHNLSGTSFATSDILTGSPNGSTAEVLALKTVVIITVADTTGMNNGDSIDIRDSGAGVLQSGIINTVIDGNHLLVDTLSGGYFDASQAFFDVDDTTTSVISAVSDIQYGMDIKVTSGDWATESSFTNGIDTANTSSTSFSNFGVGDTLTDNTSGASAIVVSNTGNGTSFATLTIQNIIGIFSDLDELSNGSGAIAYQVGAISLLTNYYLNQVVIWNKAVWANISGTNGGSPDIANSDWLPLSVAINSGYVEEWDRIIYDFDTDTIKWRFDKRGNKINNYSFNYFQFGDNLKYGCIMTDDNQYLNTWNSTAQITGTISGQGGSAVCDNTSGQIVFDIRGFGAVLIATASSGSIFVEIGLGCSVTVTGNSGTIVATYQAQSVVDHTGNAGLILNCEFKSASYITLVLNSGYIHQECEYANATQIITFDPATSYIRKRLTNTESSFDVYFDPTPLMSGNVLDLTINPTIQNSLQYAGIWILTGTVADISNIIGLNPPDAPIYPFRIVNASGVSNAIQPIPIVTAGYGDIVSDGGRVVLTGRANGNDFYELISSGSFFMKNNVVALK